MRFQQYFDSINNIYNIIKISDLMNSSQNAATVDPHSNASPAAAVPRLTKFKPWVFRPKKVLYSLPECAPCKKPYSTSHWTEAQNNQYLCFLLKFQQILKGERKLRRKWHLNRIMSKYLGTRSHQQCRSHHQKMMKTYHSIEGIIQHFQKTDKGLPMDVDSSQDSKRQGEPQDNQGEDVLFGVLDWSQGEEFNDLPLPFLDNFESNFI